MPRSVVVDDTDPSIIYSGGDWSNDTSPATGNFGAVYLQSLHRTSVSGIIEFSFVGTRFNVFGTNSPVEDANNPDPDYECFIDDASVGRDPAFNFTESNWQLCHAENLADGLHKLRIDVTVTSSDHPFYFDYIHYGPSASVPLDDKVIFVENTDPIVSFDSTWSQYHGAQANLASTTGATAQVDFVGTSLTWVGIVPSDHPHNASTAKYSIDGGRDYQVLLRGLPASSSTTYNEVHFTTPEFDAGSHTLTVTYLGSNETTPMLLDYLLIRNGSSATVVTSGSSSPTGAALPAPSSNSKPAGAIVGGILGGIAILLFIAIVFFFWRRRKLSQAYSRHERMPDPFNVNESVVYSTQGALPIQIKHIRQASGTQPIPPPIHPNTKRRELLSSRNATDLRPSTSSVPIGSAYTQGRQSVTRTPPTNIVMRQHLDSGVRLNQPIIQDIPPDYTPD